MKKSRKICSKCLTLLLTFMMMSQLCSVYAITLVDGVPSEVKNSEGYQQIAVTYNGQDGENIQVELKKERKQGNPNEIFSISGTATLRIRAYAYKTGSEIKLGTYVECLGEDGNWFEMDWRDREDQVSIDSLDQVPSITVTDIDFESKENKNDNRLKIKMKASTGGTFERATAKNVQFANTQGLTITRTVKEVENLKNVWDVEIKVQGKAKSEPVPTDIVLVLDRSGSMKNKAGNTTRAKLVEKASKELVEELTKTANTRVAVVSFGGKQIYGRSEKQEYYKAGTWTPIIKKQNGIYPTCKVETDFTNNSSQLNKAISNALGNVEQGTPIALGLIKAGILLQESSANNKYIILLSDGEATYSRDGSGEGYKMTSEIKQDLVNAAEQVKARNITLFTIAAGEGITRDGKDALQQCASQTSYAYEAEDTQAALNEVMSDVASNIDTTVTTTKLIEGITSQFNIMLPKSKNFTDSVKVADYASFDSVDWDNVAAVMTQGTMAENTLSKQGMQWEIGDITSDKPAIIRYRVKMVDGDLGRLYPVSNNAHMTYTDEKGKNVERAIPNSSLKASWAQVNVKAYLDGKEMSVPELTVWAKVPDDFKVGDLNLSGATKIDTGKQEITPSGNQNFEQMLNNNVSGENLIVTGFVVDGTAYEPEELMNDGFDLKKVKAQVYEEYQSPDIDQVVDSNVNFIQPEGITNVTTEITFNQPKSTDVAYKLDITQLLNKELDGKKMMQFDMSKVSVYVADVTSGTSTVLSKNTDYRVSPDTDAQHVTINLTGQMVENQKLRIGIYIPTSMNQQIDYKAYKNNYTIPKVKISVPVVVAYKPVYTQIIGGMTREVVGNVQHETKQIELAYWEMAKIS